MEKGHSDLEDYWNELNALQERDSSLNGPDDQGRSVTVAVGTSGATAQSAVQLQQPQQTIEGEDEAEWLKDAGLGHLSDTFRQGREIADSDVNASVRLMPEHQIDAVKRRVRLLNQTIKNRYRQQRTRHKKPDIRDVFKDIETSSTGTRSRSATPDSLDSEEESATSHDWSGSRELLTAASSQTSVAEGVKQTEGVSQAVRPRHELFARSGHHWSVHRVDVASDTEGIELLGYQRFGTIHGLRWGTVRHRSGSVPTVSLSALDLQTGESLASVPNCPVSAHTPLVLPIRRTNVNENQVSFESLFGKFSGGGTADEQKEEGGEEEDESGGRLELNASGQLRHQHEMLHISDRESSAIRPLLWLELSAIFDKFSIPCKKRIPYKRKRKELGNVFGVSLSTLVMRDRRINNGAPDTDTSTVPLIFMMVLEELESRCSNEEGILRIAGHKQRVETICAQIETDLYEKPDQVRATIKKSTCHELTSILKRLLRQLPQPLLTTQLIDLFYRCHQLPPQHERRTALNLLVLLLPIEHSGTLRILVSFLNRVVQNERNNKMSLHNVAMIIAPSLFPPSSLQIRIDPSDIEGQVRMAAVCCQLVESLLQTGLDLWRIPENLWLQHLSLTGHQQLKPGHQKPKELLHRSNTTATYDYGSSTGYTQ